MRELRPCRRCGRVPTLVPYEQSIDGNHDRPAKVACRCGNGHAMTWRDFYLALRRVPNDKRGRGYMSRAEIEAINDYVAEAWNAEQTD